MKNNGKGLTFVNDKYQFIKESAKKINSKIYTNLSKNFKTIILLIFFFFLLSSPSLSSELKARNYHFKNNLNKFFVPNTYRIAFVFGTRPEAIKLFPLIKELKKNNKFISITINTGQRKEMIQQILNSNNMDNSIDFKLNTS